MMFLLGLILFLCLGGCAFFGGLLGFGIAHLFNCFMDYVADYCDKRR